MELALGNRRLVVLGIPWEVDTNGLKVYLSKFGTLDDVVVMKDRESGRSRGFGYVTFASNEGAEKALTTQHVLNGRVLEVKVATPKEDMKVPVKGITRIFVARIPLQVSQAEFKRHFEAFGTVTDIYMPKEHSSSAHRGIGFITFASPDSVEKAMAKTHQLGGVAVAVDRATPKEESGKEFAKHFDAGIGKFFDTSISGAYGAYSSYIAAAANAARLAATGLPPFGFDSRMMGFGAGVGSFLGIKDQGGLGSSGRSSTSETKNTKKIFVGRLPSDISSDDLQRYFSSFGQIIDIYLPKDPKKSGHKGFGFVTFANEGTAERVTRRSHELLGHQIAVESATPLHEGGGLKADTGSARKAVNAMMFPGSSFWPDYKQWGTYGGRGVGPIYGGPLGGNKSKMDPRYTPYKK